MYIICYTTTNESIQLWEYISGEDAMQIRVYELTEKLGIPEDDIMVFNVEDAI